MENESCLVYDYAFTYFVIRSFSLPVSQAVGSMSGHVNSQQCVRHLRQTFSPFESHYFSVGHSKSVRQKVMRLVSQ